MSVAIDEMRAMLAAFRASPWRELHARSGPWELFFAKSGGGANPMIGAVTHPGEIQTIDAPHLGMFFPMRVAGDTIGAGDVVGQIEVLGEREDIRATRGGRIAAMLFGEGALVEYAMPLVRVAVAT